MPPKKLCRQKNYAVAAFFCRQNSAAKNSAVSLKNSAASLKIYAAYTLPPIKTLPPIYCTPGRGRCRGHGRGHGRGCGRGRSCGQAEKTSIYIYLHIHNLINTFFSHRQNIQCILNPFRPTGPKINILIKD